MRELNKLRLTVTNGCVGKTYKQLANSGKFKTRLIPKLVRLDKPRQLKKVGPEIKKKIERRAPPK